MTTRREVLDEFAEYCDCNNCMDQANALADEIVRLLVIREAAMSMMGWRGTEREDEMAVAVEAALRAYREERER
jgi:hypothetical protein